ncbi:MAG TPA: prepilin-type N-terminal cleavage/methylation domain-containing protein [Polyangiaceae bacterium]|nr:prepilin-type N-terminal cleavage/methylation domain-containing protein [Polyangiaceae bacterium]
MTTTHRDEHMTRNEELGLRLRRITRASQRGVTLVEVLIVVAIMALIAGGVGFMILPKYRESQVKTATTNARNIRAVATQYIALKGGDCPTVDVLIAERELDADGGGVDPWNNPYTISCSGDDISVSSPGPDGQEGTEDDIVVGGAPVGEG